MSELSEARANAAAHRAAFLATADALHAKVIPLADAAHDAAAAVDRAKRRGEKIADDAVRVIKEPKAISAVVGVATALVSFKLFRRLLKGREHGDDR